MGRAHDRLPVRSGGSEGGRKVKSATVSLLMVMAPFLSVAAGTSLDDVSVSRRIEVRVETLANREGGPVESCEVIQADGASSARSFASWSTLGEVGFAETEPSGKAGQDSLRRTVWHCGAGTFPGNAQAPSGATRAPFLIHEVSPDVGWYPGALGPGPAAPVHV